MDALADVGHEAQVLGPAAVEVVQQDLACRLAECWLAHAFAKVVPALGGGAGEGVRGGVATEHLVALLQHQVALPLQQPGVAPGVAVDLHVGALGDPLGVADDVPGPLVAHDAVVVGPRDRLVGGVVGDQVVFEADQEHRAAGVALAPGAAPELVVQAAARVPARPDDVQAAQLGDPLAEPDVGAPPGHLGGHGDRRPGAGPGDDRGLLGVVLGVEHDAVETLGAQVVRQALGLGHVEGADQDRAPRRVDARDLLDQRPLLVACRAENAVGLVDADARLVRGHDRDLQAVELPEVLLDRHRRARHATYFGIAADEALDGDRIEDLAGLARREGLLGLHRRLEAVGPALQGRHPAA